MKNYFVILFFGFLHSCGENNSDSNKLLLGEKVYSKNCIGCHELRGAAPNLTYHTLELSGIIATVKYGKSSMPAYKGIISENEIEDVSYYIYKQKKTNRD